MLTWSGNQTQPPRWIEASFVAGNPALRWFMEFPDEQIAWFVVAAVRQLIGLRVDNRVSADSLSPVFPVVKLASFVRCLFFFFLHLLCCVHWELKEDIKLRDITADAIGYLETVSLYLTWNISLYASKNHSAFHFLRISYMVEIFWTNWLNQWNPTSTTSLKNPGPDLRPISHWKWQISPKGDEQTFYICQQQCLAEEEIVESLDQRENVRFLFKTRLKRLTKYQIFCWLISIIHQIIPAIIRNKITEKWNGTCFAL